MVLMNYLFDCLTKLPCEDIFLIISRYNFY